MSRRTLTSLLAFGLALLLTIAAFVVPVPYVLLRGGPTFDTLGVSEGGVPVIEIVGREVFDDTSGRLDLTTVNVVPELTLGQALLGWWDRDQAVVPRDLLYPPGRTDEQVREENDRLMVASQSSATTAALLELGVPVTVAVGEVAPDGAAAGVLETGDEIVAVDGAAVTSPAQLRELLAAGQPGSTVRLDLVRDGAEQSRDLVTRAAEDDPARPVIGIGTVVSRYPFEVMIGLEEVGGPSAGLMFALGIIDKLTPGPLADGRYVAGTGEITPEGQVGPIGGIQQKLARAGEQDVDVFLVPADNCAAAEASVPEGLQLVRVATLPEAVDALELLADGGTPAGC